MDAGRVDFLSEVDEALILVRPRGRWDRDLRVDLSQGLRKCLAEGPRAILVDLAELEDPDGRCVTVLLTGYHAATENTPPVRLLICQASGPVARRLRQTGLSQRIATFDSMAEARRAVDDSVPLPASRQLELRTEHPSPALARNLVTECCAQWQLDYLIRPARMVVSELALNAVTHASSGGRFVVTVTLRHPLLHIAVRDLDPGLPQLPPRGRYGYDPHRPLAPDRGGLRLVAAYADAWGAMPCRVGKVVWGTLVTRPPRRMLRSLGERSSTRDI